MRHESQFLVIGCGIAGLSFALQAARHGSVTMLAKRGRAESNTAYAQGGIAAVLSPQDSFEQHAHGTLGAGSGLCRAPAVRLAVEEGPARVRELIELGADFTRESSPLGYHLTREGGHSQRRVVHAADMTGREVERTLLAAADRAEIRIVDDHVAIDLITASKLGDPGPDRALGAYVLDARTGEVHVYLAHVVVLATGGAAKVYLYTTNPDVATGAALPPAHRRGGAPANM